LPLFLLIDIYDFFSSLGRHIVIEITWQHFFSN
jgi:hypothetical protein